MDHSHTVIHSIFYFEVERVKRCIGDDASKSSMVATRRLLNNCNPEGQPEAR